MSPSEEATSAMDAPGIGVRVFGTGSRGNATLLRFDTAMGPRHVLLDIGFSPRRLTRLLGEEGLLPAELDAVVLTHADQDHFHPNWAPVLERLAMPVHAHRRHRSRLVHHGLGGRTLELFDAAPFVPGQPGAATEPGGGERPTFTPTMCAHDDGGSAAFVIEHRGTRLGWATDLGRVPARLTERFQDLDAVAIESNYDRAMQRASPRPAFLKQRIMGGAGHLENEQALDAVLGIEATSPGGLGDVLLLHLSRDCNRPDLVRTLWRARAPHLEACLTITGQDEASAWRRVAPRRSRLIQGALFA